MNVLVVGGAGYVGSHCVRELISQGEHPVVLDNLVYGHRQSIPQSVAFYKNDLGDIEAVRTILKKESIDIVMHFAAYAYVGESVEDPLKYYLNNVAQSLNLLKAMELEEVTRFIFSSSCTVYGVPATLPITEDMPLSPISPYGQTKLDVERALEHLAAAGKMSFASFRYFNAAGASAQGDIGEDHTPETHLIPLVFDAALGKRESISIMGTDYDTHDGTCLRDYVHVEDLARAHILVFDKLKTQGTALCYNLGTGKPSSVKEVISAVENVTGKSIHSIPSHRRQGDPPMLYADASKAKRDLGWIPKFHTLESIIASAWTWHQNNPHGYED